jgi:hypothetical protein
MFGVVASIFSLVMGYILKSIGTEAGIVFMLMVAFAQNLFMLAWTPDINQTYIIFLLAFGFGISQSIGYGQVRGIFKIK